MLALEWFQLFFVEKSPIESMIIIIIIKQVLSPETKNQAREDECSREREKESER